MDRQGRVNKDEVEACIFPVATYGAESWMMRERERKKFDAFQLWCWRKLLEILRRDKRTNSLILKNVDPGMRLKHLSI